MQLAVTNVMLSNESFFWSFRRRAKGESSGLGIHPNHLALALDRNALALASFSGSLGLKFVSCCFVLDSKCWGCCVFVDVLSMVFVFALSLRSWAFWPWIVYPAAQGSKRRGCCVFVAVLGMVPVFPLHSARRNDRSFRVVSARCFW